MRYSDSDEPTKDEPSDAHVELALHLSQQQYTGRFGDPRAQIRRFIGDHYLAINANARVGSGSESLIYDRRKQPSEEGVEDELHGKADTDFRWWSLLENPSPWGTQQQLLWEVIQQLGIHGDAMVWNVPNGFGKTIWRIPIPMSLVTPLHPGYRRDMPYGGIRVNTLQWIGRNFSHPLAGVARQDGRFSFREIPIDRITLVAFPHPEARGDGYSPITAMERWAQILEGSEKAQANQYELGPNRKVMIPYSGTNPHPTTAELDAEQRKWERRWKDTDAGVIIVPPGTIEQGAQEITMDPETMQYGQTGEQYGRLIRAGHGVNDAVAGLVDGMTYGSVAAAMQAYVSNVLQPVLNLIAAEDTAAMKREEGPAFYIHHRAPKPHDPELEQRDKELELQKAQIAKDLPFVRVNQILKMLGLPKLPGMEGEIFMQDVNASQQQQAPPQKIPGQPTQGVANEVAQEVESKTPEMPRIMEAEKAQVKSLVRMENVQDEPAPVIAFDLDGTLAEYADYVPGVIGEPRREMIELAKLLHEAGVNIVVYTSRDEDEAVSTWLDIHGVPYCGINENIYAGPTASSKMLFDVLIDDRTISARTTEGIILQGVIAHLGSEEWAKRIGEAAKARKFNKRYGYLCVPITGKFGQKIKQLQGKINPDHLSGKGLEDELHITVLYGMVGGYEADIAKILSQVHQPQIVLNRALSVFGAGGPHDGATGEVAVVVELTGESLHSLHKICERSFAHIDSFPTYRPHITLGYIGEEYADHYRGMTCAGGGTKVDRLIYKHPGQPDLTIPLRG